VVAITTTSRATRRDARPSTQADLAAVTERVRRRVIRWFRRNGLLDANAAADMLAWDNSGFSIDASVRITLLDRDVPSYFQSLEHLNHRLWRAVTALAIGNVGKQREAAPGPGTAPKTGPAGTSQRPAGAHTQFTGGKMVAKVPLAGLSVGRPLYRGVCQSLQPAGRGRFAVMRPLVVAVPTHSRGLLSQGGTGPSD
jgi:hypothetical protein